MPNLYNNTSRIICARSFFSSSYAATTMCTCGGSTGSLEVLCCLLKLIGIAKSSVQESDAVVTKDRFKHIETKMEELQLKTVREMLYRESGAMQQLRHVERYVNEIIMGCQDAQSSTRFVVDNLGKIDKALAAACESAAAVWDAQYKVMQSIYDRQI